MTTYIERDSIDEMVHSVAMSPRGAGAEWATWPELGVSVIYQTQAIGQGIDRPYVARIWAGAQAEHHQDIWPVLASATLPYATDDETKIRRTVERVARQAALAIARRSLRVASAAAQALAVIEDQAKDVLVRPMEQRGALVGAIITALESGISRDAVLETCADAARTHADENPTIMQILAPDAPEKIGPRYLEQAERAAASDRYRGEALDDYRDALSRRGTAVLQTVTADLAEATVHADRARTARDEAIRQAVASGMRPVDVKAVTGLTLSRIGQIIDAGGQ